MLCNHIKSFLLTVQVMRFKVTSHQEVLPKSYGKMMLFQKGQRPQLAKSAAAQEILELKDIKSVLVSRYSITVMKTGLNPW
jgi:hypothetical protein